MIDINQAMCNALARGDADWSLYNTEVYRGRSDTVIYEKDYLIASINLEQANFYYEENHKRKQIDFSRLNALLDYYKIPCQLIESKDLSSLILKGNPYNITKSHIQTPWPGELEVIFDEVYRGGVHTGEFVF